MAPLQFIIYRSYNFQLQLGGPLDVDDSINPNRFPRQDQNTPQLQLPNGWDVLWAKYPRYASNFLNCNQCSKKPHCHCARVDVCNKTCPNKADVARYHLNSLKSPHISHCPICLRVSNAKNKGISSHNFSDLIDVYCCASCATLYDTWMKATELKLKNEMKCDPGKGECLDDWNCELFNICLIEIWVVP